MRLLGALALAQAPCLAVGYWAVRDRALGADGGVLWCVALIGLLLTVCVVGSHLERRHA